MTKQILCTLLASALIAQQPKPAAPAAVSPAPAKPKPAASSPVDTIIQLVKSGMSESLVIGTIRRAGKAYQLTPADLLKLQKAGVSENIIQAMMDPTAATAPASAPPAATSSAAVAVAADPSGATPFPPDLPRQNQAPRKRRIAVMPFDYAAVTTWVQYWFKNDVNIGQGIRAMLTARMGQAKNIILLERARMDAIEKELNLSKSGKVNQATGSKSGRLTGADCILLGDITIFGRDDKATRSSNTETISRFGRYIPGMRHQATAVGQFSKEEKAVVGIALRIVDVESGEVLATGESRGESSRSSKNWDSFASTLQGGTYNTQSEHNSMTSSNFQQTIIGEATSNAVDNILKYLDDQIPQMQIRTRGVEGRVAKVSGGNPILGIGANDGVEYGDRFEILKIVSEVLDPTTKEVLDLETVKVGEFVASNVRERTATGNYGGQPLYETYTKGYTARLVVQ